MFSRTFIISLMCMCHLCSVALIEVGLKIPERLPLAFQHQVDIYGKEKLHSDSW